MAQVPDSVMENLKKIKALADRGATDGEKDVAKAHLDRLLKKHKVAYEDLFDDKYEWYTFRWKTERERLLLMCCLYTVVGWDTRVDSTTRSKSRYGRMENGWQLKLTAKQFVDVSVYYAHFLKEWDAHVKAMFAAFISKNGIARPLKENEQPNERTAEEEDRLQEMFGAVKRTTPLKQLGE